MSIKQIKIKCIDQYKVEQFKQIAIFFGLAAFSLVAWWLLTRPVIEVQPSVERVVIKGSRFPHNEIEYFVMEPTLGRPWPAVLFIHGQQEGKSAIGGRAFIDSGIMKKTVDKKTLAVAISLPGFGMSDGPPDLKDKVAQSAIKDVIEDLKARDDLKAGKIALVGISDGAIVSSRVAAKSQSLAGAVLISGNNELKALAPRHKRKLALKQPFLVYATESREISSELLEGEIWPFLQKIFKY